VLISNRVILGGYDGHPLDPLERAKHAPCGPEGARPILIRDFAWIGANAIILRGVEIGAGSVVATGAVVTRNVEPLTVVAGNPAKVIRRIPEPQGWAVRAQTTE
jgi:acetyltransferase-like isoleucine patch superfamily enzyme